jgi:hypothetical protein
MSESIEDPSWLELIKAFETALIHVEEIPIEYEYRVYYDENGFITNTSCLKKDEILPDRPYLIVSKDEFDNFHKYIVIKNKLIERKDNAGQLKQIVKSTTGFLTVKNNPALLIEQDESYTDTEYYDYRNY